MACVRCMDQLYGAYTPNGEVRLSEGRFVSRKELV